jgi:hypothetical protein
MIDGDKWWFPVLHSSFMLCIVDATNYYYY